jgi:hypothetical protein
MQKGFNSDISVKGKVYHIQTEDWGQQNPFIVSRIFCNGAVHKTIKTSHAEAIRTGPINNAEAIREALKRQHNRVIDSLVQGQQS